MKPTEIKTILFPDFMCSKPVKVKCTHHKGIVPLSLTPGIRWR